MTRFSVLHVIKYSMSGQEQNTDTLVKHFLQRQHVYISLSKQEDLHAKHSIIAFNSREEIATPSRTINKITIENIVIV